jgi:hypothetical protein
MRNQVLEEADEGGNSIGFSKRCEAKKRPSRIWSEKVIRTAGLFGYVFILYKHNNRELSPAKCVYTL